MRILVIAVAIASVLWSGYWVIGSRGASWDAAQWFAERTADGWVARYSDVQTRGFPNRFDTTLSGVTLSDPVSGLGWAAPFLQILRLSYRPAHVILIFPESQVIETPRHRVYVTSVKAQASAVFAPGANAPLPRATILAEALSLSAEPGWSAMIDRLLISIRDSPAAERSYDLDVHAQRIDLALGATPLDLLALNGTLAFDASFDRRAFAGRRPALTGIELRTATVRWGAVILDASGSLTVDAAGLLNGALDLDARNWREMLRVAQGAGWLSVDLADRIMAASQALSGGSGEADALTATLRFSRGEVSLGPDALGQVPQIRLFQRQ